MANPTMTLIASNTVGSGGASSVTFSSIPQTYTDLVVKINSRVTSTDGGGTFTFNGSAGKDITLYAFGSGSPGSVTHTTNMNFFSSNSTDTASTFNSAELYISNYSNTTNYKSVSIDNITENNGTTATATLIAALWSNTAAITSITFTGFSNFVQYSTFYLYGISNS